MPRDNHYQHVQPPSPKLPLTTLPAHAWLYLHFNVKHKMCQILSYTATLIFTTTKEVGVIATLPSREMRRQMLSSPSHTAMRCGSAFHPPTASSPTRPISSATSCRFSYSIPARVSYHPLSPHKQLEAPAVVRLQLRGLFTVQITVFLAASSSTCEGLRGRCCAHLGSTLCGLGCHRRFSFPHLNCIPVKVTGCLLKTNRHLRRLKILPVRPDAFPLSGRPNQISLNFSWGDPQLFFSSFTS